MLIAGDIGGTKTLIGLYTQESGARRPQVQKSYRSADYPDLATIVRQFLDEIDAAPKVACFDVAGPVVDGRANVTNLPWVIEEASLCREVGLDRVVLLNDLKAVAHAIPRLEPGEWHVLNQGRPDPEGAVAVVAPGTGLGEAFLVRSGGEYLACPSEGGHADFAPADEMQAELYRYLAKRYGHVAYERVCSGSGIPNLYEFLRDTRRAPERPDFARQLAEKADRTPPIVEAGMDDAAGNPLCAATLDLFIAILAAEAGNLALRVLASGGVYLAGGMPPRVLGRLDRDRFMASFTAKGRFQAMLADIPVRVVTADAALIGAALYGLDQLDMG